MDKNKKINLETEIRENINFHGLFWNYGYAKEYTKSGFIETFLNDNPMRPFRFHIMYLGHIYVLSIIKDKNKVGNMIIFWGNCIEYSIQVYEDDTVDSILESFSTDCDDIINGDLKITKPSAHLLTLIDVISKFFGVRRLSLSDASRSKTNDDVNLSLYMVMKHGLTFYERYGFKFCKDDYRFDFDTYKILLREFNFKIFYELLSDNHKQTINKYLFKLKKKVSDFEILGDFYVMLYDKYRDLSDRYIIIMQKILYDKSYPWYCMVDVINKRKSCMEKFYITTSIVRINDSE